MPDFVDPQFIDLILSRLNEQEQLLIKAGFGFYKYYRRIQAVSRSARRFTNGSQRNQRGCRKDVY